jgi:predicted dehydrogenase
MGCIGLGGMGTNDMRAFLTQPDVQILAVCDPVKMSNEYEHWYQHGWNGNYFGREAGKNIVNDYYAKLYTAGAYNGCTAHIDFREIIDRDDIDAVTIVTPDHWHAVIAVAAANAGKHVYCEKPMTLTINEGKAVVKAVRDNGVTFQTGSHRRSDSRVRYACELVRNGRIGTVEKIITTIGTNNKVGPTTWDEMPIPDGFDYDMWLGPAPYEPYHKDRCLYKFRFIKDYSGGQTTNLGAHSIDVAQWGNGTDLTGPVEVEDLGGVFPQDGLFNTATFVHFRARYANGVEFVCKTEERGVSTRFEGSDGWLEISGDSNAILASDEAMLQSKIQYDEIHLYESEHHQRNLIDCIKNGNDPSAPVEIGHRSNSICLLGNIAMELQRKLEWDPQSEVFINDDEANKMLSKPLRAPWRI